MKVEIPAKIACVVKAAPLPQLYEEAKKAIAECARLDECAGWADKAAAIASRQADDLELETCAHGIRDRAIRRCGELLRGFDARGGDRSKNVTPLPFAPRSRHMVAQEAGLSEHKARTAVNIAAIPEAEFEAAVESKRPPGTTLLSQWNKLHPRERVRSVTKSSLAEISRSVFAGRALEGMFEFEKSVTACGLDVVVEILRGHTRQLERVRRGIGLAFRLNSALDKAGLRGHAMLRPLNF